MQLSLTTSKGTSNYNLIKELQNRSDELHKTLEKCQRQVTLIQELKQDKSIVEEVIAQLWSTLHKLQVELDEKTN